MLKKGKTGNHNGQLSRKTEVSHCKSRKTDLDNGQNRKSQRPPREGRAFFNFLSQKRRGGGRRLRYELIAKPGIALDNNSVELIFRFRCQAAIDTEIFDLGCLGPAVSIYNNVKKLIFYGA